MKVPNGYRVIAVVGDVVIVCRVRALDRKTLGVTLYRFRSVVEVRTEGLEVAV